MDTKVPLLRNGEHLNQRTFHKRYEAAPEDFRAELVGGIVFLRTRRTRAHGALLAKVGSWLCEYGDATPGTEGLLDVTVALGPASELEPDACLLHLPKCGGQTWEDEDGYINGAPEWVGEVSDSTESIDRNRKKLDYEKAGVREYMVAALRTGQVFWYIRRRGKFKEMAPGSDGIFRSEVFPGLWLDPAAFLKRDGKRVLAVLHQGLASPEHATFVAKLKKAQG